MELFVFARFHAREGQEAALAQAICESVTASREEAGCLNIHAFRSVRGPHLFYIHSRWKDEAAFDLHAELATACRGVDWRARKDSNSGPQIRGLGSHVIFRPRGRI